MFKAYEIKPGIYWVGVIEWNERYIHGFSMPHGSTNNAYLIMDNAITLIDCCTPGFEDQLLARISSVVDPARIDYIIANHCEKDHAGTLGNILAAAPHAKVITSNPKGMEILKRYLGPDAPVQGVKSGDELCIGKRTLQFIHTPMVHWPDSMVTYCPTDKVLFSNDAFGQFLATSKRFDDEVDESALFAAAKKYYANIVMPFSKQTARVVETVKGLALDLIAPSHGLIWRSNISRILDAYAQWSSLQPKQQAVVAYASMYGSTERMATAITEAFMEAGIPVRMFDIRRSDISDIMTEVMDAEYVAVGSATHNGTVLPPAGAFLTYLKGLAPKGRTGIAFGSYGWMAAGAKEIAEVLTKTGYDVPLEPITCDWNETGADAEAISQVISNLVS